MKRSPKHGGDASQVAWQVVQEATGQAKPVEPRPKDPAAVERGRAGGLARAQGMTVDQRIAAAKQARAPRTERAAETPKRAVG